MTLWAVITGDIVKSSAMSTSELDAIFGALTGAARDIATWQDGPVPLARFRGDGWQMALPPGRAFRALIALRATVRAQGKGFDSRAALGVGEGTLGTGGLAGADGPAFVASGRALDEMKRGRLMAAPDAGQALRACLPLADQIIVGWTPKQAQVIAALIVPQAPTQAEIARDLGIRRQSVQKQADAAGLDALLDACTALELPSI